MTLSDWIGLLVKFDYGTVIFCPRKPADRRPLKDQKHEMLFSPLNGVPHDTYWLSLQNPVGYITHLQRPMTSTSQIPLGVTVAASWGCYQAVKWNEVPLGDEQLSLNWMAEWLFQIPDGYPDLDPSLTSLYEPLIAYIIDGHSFPSRRWQRSKTAPISNTTEVPCGWRHLQVPFPGIGISWAIWQKSNSGSQ